MAPLGGKRCVASCAVHNVTQLTSTCPLSQTHVQLQDWHAVPETLVVWSMMLLVYSLRTCSSSAGRLPALSLGRLCRLKTASCNTCSSSKGAAMKSCKSLVGKQMTWWNFTASRNLTCMLLFWLGAMVLHKWLCQHVQITSGAHSVLHSSSVYTSNSCMVKCTYWRASCKGVSNF